jgi:hypothetical protein
MYVCCEGPVKHYILCYRPSGYLFDKEAILEYIITKKNEYFRKLKEYEKQKRKEEVILLEMLCFHGGVCFWILFCILSVYENEVQIKIFRPKTEYSKGMDKITT